MDSSAFREILPQITRTQKFAWWFINITNFFFIFPFYVGNEQQESIHITDTYEASLYFLCFVCAGGVYVYRRWALAPERLRQILTTDVTSDMLRTALSRVEDKLVTQIGALPQEEQRQIYLVKKLQDVLVVSLFMHEVIIGSGVSLARQKNDLISLIPFLIATFALNLLIYPKPEQVLKQLVSQNLEKDEAIPL